MPDTYGPSFLLEALSSLGDHGPYYPGFPPPCIDIPFQSPLQGHQWLIFVCGPKSEHQTSTGKWLISENSWEAEMSDTQNEMPSASQIWSSSRECHPTYVATPARKWSHPFHHFAPDIEIVTPTSLSVCLFLLFSSLPNVTHFSPSLSWSSFTYTSVIFSETFSWRAQDHHPQASQTADVMSPHPYFMPWKLFSLHRGQWLNLSGSQHLAGPGPSLLDNLLDSLLNGSRLIIACVWASLGSQGPNTLLSCDGWHFAAATSRSSCHLPSQWLCVSILAFVICSECLV